MKTIRRPVLSVLLALPLIALDGAFAAEAPEVNEDGMHRVKDTELATVYADPEANLSGYDRILLQDATVAFRKQWQRDQNRDFPRKVSDKDMQRIREEIAGIFREVFTEALEEAGYTITDQPGVNVLRVTPSIVDLDITAPDTDRPVRVMQFSEEAGEMTLHLELFDSRTGDKLAKAIDRKRDYRHGYLEWRTSVSNRADARRMMKAWAKAFVSLLDETRASVTGY